MCCPRRQNCVGNCVEWASRLSYREYLQNMSEITILPFPSRCHQLWPLWLEKCAGVWTTWRRRSDPMCLSDHYRTLLCRLTAYYASTCKAAPTKLGAAIQERRYFHSVRYVLYCSRRSHLKLGSFGVCAHWSPWNQSCHLRNELLKTFEGNSKCEKGYILAKRLFNNCGK